jgi:hypothetical protein
MLSLNWSIHIYCVLNFFKKDIQDYHQCLHGCGQQLETLVSFLQTLFLQLGKTKMQASDDFCYFSHNCPFEEATT